MKRRGDYCDDCSIPKEARITRERTVQKCAEPIIWNAKTSGEELNPTQITEEVADTLTAADRNPWVYDHDDDSMEILLDNSGAPVICEWLYEIIADLCDECPEAEEDGAELEPLYRV
jgi:hypothetical protein